MLKNLQILTFLIFSTLAGFAQLDGADQKDKWAEDNIFLDGVISDYYSGESITGVSITASAEGGTITKGTSDENGEYKLVLEYDKIYTISFSKGGFTSKTITINTNGVPYLKKQKVPDMGAEITLFKPNDCIKTEMLNAPIGRAVYFPKKNVMDWDMEYSMPRIEKLNKMLEKCKKEAEKQKAAEEQKERDYNAAMKEANKAFAKEDFNQAVEAYKKAIALFNDRPEPKIKLKLIETEIAKKAEAEKQRAEEKARAEAESIAKAEAEVAAKRAIEEKIAKEEAKSLALAKAQEEARELAKAKEAAKIAEEKAKQKEALIKAKEAEQAKTLAQQEVIKRKAAEEKALEEKLAANKRAEKERKAKELAAELAKKAEKERAENQVVLQETKEDVIVEIAKQEEAATLKTTEKVQPKSELKGKTSITFKRSNPTRHLYQRPNKHRKGKGLQPKKRIVF